MKDLPNVMSKLLNLGVPLGEVIRAVTWTPATSIQHPELGHLSEGAEADVTVLALERGSFGFLDSAGARFTGTRRILPQLTLRKGVVVWDLEGRSTVDWRRFPYKPRASRP
jgi:dihydroorotase